MSPSDKPTGKVTDAVDTDVFGGSSTDVRLDDPGGGNALSSPSVLEMCQDYTESTCENDRL